MGRYTRDEIITQALDLAHCPNVSKHDIPDGIVQPDAWSIKWLQNGLDLFHRLYPFASDIQTTDLVLPANNTDAYLLSDPTKFIPDDFIVDVRNGIEVSVGGRNYRPRKLSYQYWFHYKVSYGTQPSPAPLCYTVVNKRFKVLPLLSESVSATLHYFALPTAPTSDDYVEFPDEFTLIEFVRLKALEWTRAREVPPGSAQEYMRRQLGQLRSSGLLNEAEYDDGVPLENRLVVPESRLLDRYGWMGSWPN